MTVLKIRQFNKTLSGRFTAILLAIAVFNLTSCKVYVSAETNMAEVKNTKQILENLDIYDFYVHDQYGSYSLTNPVFNADGSISGNLVEVNYEKPDSSWSHGEKKAYWQDHKYDISIYSKETIGELRADLNPSPIIETSSVVTIKADMIEKMTITSIDAENELGVIALVCLVILGIIAVLALLIILIAASGEASSDGSDGSSDGSSDGGSGSSG